MGEELTHALVLGLLALGAGALGHWGRSHALDLAPAHLEVFDRERRIRSLQRGALACYVAAGVLLAAAVLSLV